MKNEYIPPEYEKIEPRTAEGETDARLLGFEKGILQKFDIERTNYMRSAETQALKEYRERLADKCVNLANANYLRADVRTRVEIMSQQLQSPESNLDVKQLTDFRKEFEAWSAFRKLSELSFQVKNNMIPFLYQDISLALATLQNTEKLFKGFLTWAVIQDLSGYEGGVLPDPLDSARKWSIEIKSTIRQNELIRLFDETWDASNQDYEIFQNSASEAVEHTYPISPDNLNDICVGLKALLIQNGLEVTAVIPHASVRTDGLVFVAKGLGKNGSSATNFYHIKVPYNFIRAFDPNYTNVRQTSENEATRIYFMRSENFQLRTANDKILIGTEERHHNANAATLITANGGHELIVTQTLIPPSDIAGSIAMTAEERTRFTKNTTNQLCELLNQILEKYGCPDDWGHESRIPFTAGTGISQIKGLGVYPETMGSGKEPKIGFYDLTVRSLTDEFERTTIAEEHLINLLLTIPAWILNVNGRNEELQQLKNLAKFSADETQVHNTALQSLNDAFNELGYEKLAEELDSVLNEMHLNRINALSMVGDNSLKSLMTRCLTRLKDSVRT